MPRFVTGDLWSAWPFTGLLLITTNSIVRPSGALIMGAGVARDARNRFHGLDVALGEAIRRQGDAGGRYGIMVSPKWPEKRIGAFQTKIRPGDNSSLDLIQFATDALAAWCLDHPAIRVDLPFPGIGYGRLSPDEVRPILEAALPDAVHIWAREVDLLDGASSIDNSQWRFFRWRDIAAAKAWADDGNVAIHDTGRPYRRWTNTAHLMAKDDTALRDAARRVGVQLRWIQNESRRTHYDVFGGPLDRALALVDNRNEEVWRKRSALSAGASEHTVKE